jgi:hypothetical protein
LAASAAVASDSGSASVNRVWQKRRISRAGLWETGVNDDKVDDMVLSLNMEKLVAA